jgi:hypothetical protein
MSIVSNMLNVGIETVVCASKQQVFCNVAEEAVLLSMEDGAYYGLNDVAASIWRQIQEPRSVGQIRDALLTEYCDIDESECESTVSAFLSEMISLRLVDVV